MKLNIKPGACGILLIALLTASLASAGPASAAAPAPASRETKTTESLPSARKIAADLPCTALFFEVAGRPAFLFRPNQTPLATPIPWVWYAPTLAFSPQTSHLWMFRRFLDRGIAIAGIDVGESYGNPQGREQYTAFYKTLRERYGLAERACLMPQSRGGLMLYNWAAEHPRWVAAMAGIYTVCNIASWPGLEKAAPAYGMSAAELGAQLAKHNPIDRLKPLAAAGVPILHIHGDNDKVVPMEENGGELARRYQALGGTMRLVIVPGKGHQVSPEFFESQEVVDFVIDKVTAANQPQNSQAAKSGDPLAPWRAKIRIHPVSSRPGQHTMHSYFISSPESPDGRSVLFFASTTPEGHSGELRILDRATGEERTIARGITTEDAHRAACQQWVSGGKRVVYHDCRNGQWVVAAIDLATGEEKIIARDRQLGWVRPDADLVPMYGCHWNPGEHRDLELYDLATGAVHVPVTAAAVREAYAERVGKLFGERPVSIFFPVLSPDLNRVFFKLATPAGGDFRSKQASYREGLVCFDMAQSRFRFMDEQWGHPAWHPDSRTIIQPGNVLVDGYDGAKRKIPYCLMLSGAHPSISPDGRLFVTDGMLPGDKEKDCWSIVIGRMDGGGQVVLHTFNNSRGARSWRRSDPHPQFSPDGRCIYYNVSSGDWTQLYVAEGAEAEK